MELFKINNIPDMHEGEAFEGWDSVRWVERYRDPGEFEIKTDLSSDLKSVLPLGTLISHLDTMELMIVENHEITEEEDASPQLSITGRSFETYLENRVIGQNFLWDTSPPADLESSQYWLAATPTWEQAYFMVNQHIVIGNTNNPDDGLSRVACDSLIDDLVFIAEERVIKRGTVHQRLIELLEIEDLGVRIIRAHNFPGRPFGGDYTTIEIYKGADKRNTVVFSAQNGDMSSGAYLWTQKKLKNSALVSGKFVETMVYGPETGYERRVMLVDASDIDENLDVIPTGTALDDIRALMQARGRQVLAAQKEIVLSSSDISNSPSYQYRLDYEVGDIIGLDGSFGETLAMRVVEYAEIVDENGRNGHPTLALLPSS